MFDAKKLLEAMMGGGQPQQSTGGGGGLADMLGKALGQSGGQQGGGGGGLADILGKLAGQAGGQGSGQSGAQGGGGGLADILGKLAGQQGGQQGGGQAAAPSGGGLGDMLGKAFGQGGQHASAAPAPQQAPDAGTGGGGLEDMLRKLQAQMGGAGGAAGGAGGLGDILGQVFGQAKAGVSEGARRIDDATGASGHVRAATQSATGMSQEEILAQIQDWVSKNQAGAGAAAAGAGAVVLGTHTGRVIAGKALKLGTLALIGGLAYKALQNYQSGKPLLSADEVAHVTEAPHGTGYETAAVTHDSALLYIRAMIAAAAADGSVDAREQQKIFGSLKQAGMDTGAEEFVAKELNSPATIEELASGVKNEQEAVQVFTAARLAVSLDNQETNDFLVGLANALGMDAQLVQHIDAAARSAA